MNAMKIVRYTAWALCGAVGILLGVIAFQAIEQNTEAGRKIGEAGRFGAPFTLTDHNGNTVTDALFRERPTLVFFGFTFCPDVCPTTLNEIAIWTDELGDDADKANYVFVTIDPERDTPDVLKNYVTAFTDRVIGITGEPDAVRAMARSYKVYFSKVPLDGGGYTMDHTAAIYMLDGSGDFAGTIAYGIEPDEALEKIRKLIAEG
jgi:protein SCO1/2